MFKIKPLTNKLTGSTVNPYQNYMYKIHIKKTCFRLYNYKDIAPSNNEELNQKKEVRYKS